MAKRSNGTTRINLQEAIALLIHNQAAVITEMAESNRRWQQLAAESERRFAASERRFAAIERDLQEIKVVLRELPEAIRQKIGFKTKS
jgi:hypothetical protein